jgi:hypothetical protein
MSLFLSSYTKALRSYDRDLFAGRTRDGLACVFRKAKRFVPVIEWEGGKLMTLMEDKQFIFALTDNWTARGKPVDWGIDFVLNRIKEIDAVANEQFFEKMEAENAKIDESKRRSLRNEMEGFWAHERRRFAKATDDILTHSLSKDEPKKRRKDRSIKNGNY